MTEIALFLILLTVLILPLTVKKVEEELELFLFIMGLIAVSATSQWNFALIKEALIEPCLLYTSPSPRDRTRSRMPSSA